MGKTPGQGVVESVRFDFPSSQSANLEPLERGSRLADFLQGISSVWPPVASSSTSTGDSCVAAVEMNPNLASAIAYPTRGCPPASSAAACREGVRAGCAPTARLSNFSGHLDRANVYLASARALGLVEMPFMSPRVPLRRPMANGNSTYLGGMREKPEGETISCIP